MSFVALPDPSDRVEVRHTDGTTAEATSFHIDWNHPRLESFRIISKGVSRREKPQTREQLLILEHGV